MNQYIIVTEEFALTNEGYIAGENIFNTVKTLQNQYVCSANSANEFPELFTDTNFEIMFLPSSSFKQDNLGICG